MFLVNTSLFLYRDQVCFDGYEVTCSLGHSQKMGGANNATTSFYLRQHYHEPEWMRGHNFQLESVGSSLKHQWEHPSSRKTKMSHESTGHICFDSAVRQTSTQIYILGELVTKFWGCLSKSSIMYKVIIVKNKLSTVQVSRIAPHLAPVTHSPVGQIAYVK